MKTAILSLLLAAFAVAQNSPPGGGKPILASDDSGVTLYPVRKLYFPSGTLSCTGATCTYAGGGSSTPPYSVAFSASTTETVTAATHGQGTSPMDGGCYTSAGVRRFPDSWTRNGSGDVTITFPTAFTGSCGVFNGSGGSGSSYSLPTATDSVLGGVKVGSGLSITDGVLAASGLSTVTTGPGLTGDGSSGNSVRVDPSGGVASQVLYSANLTGWGTVTAASCAEKNITAVGVQAGDAIASVWPLLQTGLSGMMYATENLIVVRLCNVTAAGVVVGDGLAFAGRVIRGF